MRISHLQIGSPAYVAFATLALPVKVTELKVLAMPVSCGSGDILPLVDSSLKPKSLSNHGADKQVVS